MRNFIKSLILFIPFIFASCDSDPRHIDTTNLPTHNPAVFAEGRYCTDYLKFECLPESRDPSILKGSEPLADGKFPFYEYDQKRFNDVVEKIGFMDDNERKIAMEKYKLTQSDYEWMEQVRLKQWYKEMEATMEKQYPGFWGDTSKPVRHRWMRLCVAKGNKYGYGVVTDGNGNAEAYNGPDPSMQQWLELCGRIGLNFDRDPKWKYIVDFIKINKDGACPGTACDYIDFTVFSKDESAFGYKFTDWSLKDALRYLPYPNRPVPRLNDPSNDPDAR